MYIELTHLGGRGLVETIIVLLRVIKIRCMIMSRKGENVKLLKVKSYGNECPTSNR